MRAIIPGENDKQQVTDLKGNLDRHRAGTRMNARVAYRRRVRGNQSAPHAGFHQDRLIPVQSRGYSNFRRFMQQRRFAPTGPNCTSYSCAALLF